jgi:hypothetical protein
LTLGRYPDRPLAEAIHERGRILKGADPATVKQAGHAENDHTVVLVASTAASWLWPRAAAEPAP